MRIFKLICLLSAGLMLAGCSLPHTLKKPCSSAPGFIEQLACGPFLPINN